MVAFLTCLKAVKPGLTPGRIYVLAVPIFSRTVLPDFLRVRGDGGVDVVLSAEDIRSGFNVDDSAWAVVVSPPRGTKFLRGEIVKVTDYTEDGLFLVFGRGYFKASCFLLLDSATIRPGETCVSLKSTGAWVRVLSFDGRAFTLDGVGGDDIVPDSAGVVSPGDCMMAVSVSDEVVSEPFLVCRDSDYEKGLTVGKKYKLLASLPDGCVSVANDDGEAHIYRRDRFE